MTSRLRKAETALEGDTSTAQVYLAGQIVPPGAYCQIEGGREIRLDKEDTLPATCDGHVAAYQRLPERWGERNTNL